MHKIDWDKYLKSCRLRDSESSQNRDSNIYDNRDDFESDFGRVVFSSASRRMHDKTQVFPLTTNDNIHSRLTHSLEVMNIGYSLGVNLCRNIDFIRIYGEEKANQLAWKICAILKTASFVHDIGNPPFGHFGEESIKDYFKTLLKHIENNKKNKTTCNSKIQNLFNSENYQNFEIDINQKSNWIFDFTEFDGNAQGFRILTKLQFLNDLYGLNLTHACLAAYLKYPNIGEGNKDSPEIACHKHGVFTTEMKYLEMIGKACSMEIKQNAYKRHPLSFFVEAADSICYLIMDIEDGINKDWYTYADLKNIFSSEISNQKITTIFQEIEAKHEGLKIPPRKQIVDFRVAIISYLVALAVKNFIENAEAIENGKYDKELIEDDDERVAVTLQMFCRKKILSKREIEYLELTGNSVITGLFDIYIKLMFHHNKKFRNRAKGMISKAILLANIKENNLGFEEEDLDDFDIENLSIETRLRIILDYVSGMTDKFALNHYKKLSGQQF